MLSEEVGEWGGGGGGGGGADRVKGVVCRYGMYTEMCE